MPGRKKVAMVAPPPAKPAAAKPAAVRSLEEILSQLGNDRPYFVISQSGQSWKIHFVGDHAAKTVKFEDSKWLIK
jgi:hypothetical protein